MKLTEEQIEKIAESIEAGFICNVNPDTGEIEELREYDEFDIYADEDPDEYDEEYLASEPEWVKESRKEIKEQMERINSWDRIIEIEKPDSGEKLTYMKDFVVQQIPEPEQNMYRKALQGKNPFSNFNIQIQDSEHLDNWYEFKKKKLMEFVREELT